MGFPLTYSDLLIPRTFLHVVFFLGQLRRFISWAFEAAGLGDLLDSNAPWTDTVAAAHAQIEHHHHQYYHYRSVSTTMVDQSLPVVRYDELEGGHVGGSCAVCLYEFDAGDQVRWLRNCRHVYHRCCLDPWLEHGRRTCPLCRTPLVGGGEEGNDPGWSFDVGPPENFEEEFTIESSFSYLLFSTQSQDHS